MTITVTRTTPTVTDHGGDPINRAFLGDEPSQCQKCGTKTEEFEPPGIDAEGESYLVEWCPDCGALYHFYQAPAITEATA